MGITRGTRAAVAQAHNLAIGMTRSPIWACSAGAHRGVQDGISTKRVATILKLAAALRSSYPHARCLSPRRTGYRHSGVGVDLRDGEQPRTPAGRGVRGCARRSGGSSRARRAVRAQGPRTTRIKDRARVSLPIPCLRPAKRKLRHRMWSQQEELPEISPGGLLKVGPETSTTSATSRLRRLLGRIEIPLCIQASLARLPPSGLAVLDSSSREQSIEPWPTAVRTEHGDPESVRCGQLATRSPTLGRTRTSSKPCMCSPMPPQASPGSSENRRRARCARPANPRRRIKTRRRRPSGAAAPARRVTRNGTDRGR